MLDRPHSANSEQIICYIVRTMNKTAYFAVQQCNQQCELIRRLQRIAEVADTFFAHYTPFP